MLDPTESSRNDLKNSIKKISMISGKKIRFYKSKRHFVGAACLVGQGVRPCRQRCSAMSTMSAKIFDIISYKIKNSIYIQMKLKFKKQNGMVY
ncbi:hypothetical protein BpHYR1_041750 [Brachionus plicatilis]|uniref:Uncharacterized protein n=1 Tax=Brachionus plicatilis TaxID=10195 RepID=A0A3M7RVI3_BRAPC|nr:hypothetical protein BpHYR1_041750 [Brachionus plicatilis]